MQLSRAQGDTMHDGKEQAKLERVAADKARGLAAPKQSRRNFAAEHTVSSAATDITAAGIAATGRWSRNCFLSLYRISVINLVGFCVGAAVAFPGNSAPIQFPSRCNLQQMAGQINKINGEPSWRSRPTVRVRAGTTEFLALVDSGASHTVMRRDTFDNISGSNKEEISGTGVGLKTANDQLFATNGTFLVKWTWRDLAESLTRSWWWRTWLGRCC